MDLLILDPKLNSALIKRRRRRGHDQFDEVWDGVYVMSPLADNEHQEIGTNLSTCFVIAVGYPGLGKVRAGSNVCDREAGWRKNYRCPDVAVYMNGTKARKVAAHWVGGPNFGVEVVSPHDRTREKLEFYAKVGTRELLIVDRYPWALELYRLGDAGTLDLVGRSTPEQPDALASRVLPLSFRLAAGADRPRIAVAHADGDQAWSA